MLCMFCGSDDLSTIETYSKGQFIEGHRAIGDKYIYHLDGETESVSIPVTKRKMKCNNCKNHFWTVEHFEKSTRASTVQKKIVDNLMLYDIGGKEDEQ